MFCGCNSVKDIPPLKNWDIKNQNNFSDMFCECNSVKDISPLKNWNIKY